MEPLKNAFSYPKARLIAEAVKRAHPAFSLPQFSKRLEVALEPLELEQRMRLIADRIEAGLPAHPPELFAILTEALAVDEGDPHGLRGFLVWPLTEIVARRGLGHFPESMAALCEMTNRFTGEFAIRPFLRKHRERTLKQLHAWCDHPDDPRLAKLARHACHTLLKSGHPGALEFHGYGSAKALELEVFALGKKSVMLGGQLDYRLVIRNSSRRAVKVMLDYAILHRKANGTLSPKVFKGRTRELAAGERWEPSPAATR